MLGGGSTITKNTKIIPITNTELWTISNSNKITIDNNGNLELLADTGTARYFATLNTSYNLSKVKQVRIKYHFDYAEYDDIIDVSVSPLYPNISIGYLTDSFHNELYVTFSGAQDSVTYTIRSSRRGHDANLISYLELLV